MGTIQCQINKFNYIINIINCEMRMEDITKIFSN